MFAESSSRAFATASVSYQVQANLANSNSSSGKLESDTGNDQRLRTPNDTDLYERAVRLLSLRVVPVLFSLALLSHLDRANLAFGASDLLNATALSDAEYGVGSGLFFIGYATMQIPSLEMARQFGVPLWLGFSMVLWGVAAASFACLSLVPEGNGKNHSLIVGVFYLLRALLGAFEAGTFPIMYYYLTLFLGADELVTAYAKVVVGTSVAGVCGGFVAAWLLSLDGVLGLAGWQWLFIGEGGFTILIALIGCSSLPRTLAETQWLSEAEKNALEAKREMAASHRADALRDGHRETRLGPFQEFNEFAGGDVEGGGELVETSWSLRTILSSRASVVEMPEGGDTSGVHDGKQTRRDHARSYSLQRKRLLNQTMTSSTCESTCSSLQPAVKTHKASIDNLSKDVTTSPLLVALCDWRSWYLSLVSVLLSCIFYGIMFWLPMLIGSLLSNGGNDNSIDSGAINFGFELGSGASSRENMRDENNEGMVLADSEPVNSAWVAMLTAIPYSCSALALMGNAEHVKRSGERNRHAALPLFVGSLGLFLLPLASHCNPAAALFCLTLATAGMGAAHAPLMSWPATWASADGHAAATFAMVNSIGNLGGGLLGPAMIGVLSDIEGEESDEAHHHTHAVLVLAVCAILAAALTLGFNPTSLNSAQIEATEPTGQYSIRPSTQKRPCSILLDDSLKRHIPTSGTRTSVVPQSSDTHTSSAIQSSVSNPQTLQTRWGTLLKNVRMAFSRKPITQIAEPPIVRVMSLAEYSVPFASGGLVHV